MFGTPHAETETSIQFERRPEEDQNPARTRSFRYDLLGPDDTHVIIWLADNLYTQYTRLLPRHIKLDHFYMMYPV